MELVNALWQTISSSALPVLGFIFVLTIVVFFHELGHFWVARRCGVKVDVFSIGFGREIFGFHDRHGTRWKVSWLPLGGYVKFFGDDDATSFNVDMDELDHMAEEERKVSFHHKKLWQRACIVAAGPVANFILAIVIYAALFVFVGQRYTLPVVDEVRPNSAAEEAGFMPGDVVLKIDDYNIKSFSDMQRIVSTSAGLSLEFVVERGGLEMTLVATPQRGEIDDGFGGKQKVGLLGIVQRIEADSIRHETFGPGTALLMGANETWFIIDRTFTYIGGIFVGRESTDQLGGPIRIAQVAGQAAQIGFATLINLTAVLSVSIGLINLFPIPMLDGGHLLFYGIEAIRGKPLSEKAQEYGFRIGLALVAALMIFSTFNDIVRIGQSGS